MDKGLQLVTCHNRWGDLFLRLLPIKGIDLRTLRDCRKLTVLYPQIRGSLTPEFQTLGGGSAIPATPSPELAKLLPIRQRPPAEAQPLNVAAIRGSANRELPTPLKPAQVLRLSRIHLREVNHVSGFAQACRQA